jgi:hypothetical protein
MGKCSTLMYLNDSANYQGIRLIDIDKLIDEIDFRLDEVFARIEIEVNNQLVKRTMKIVEELG